MNKQILNICLLTVLALTLLTLNFAMQRPATAATTVRDRDYQLATTRIQGGGEGLYVLDNRTGRVVVFVYDVGQRRVVPKAHVEISDAFAR